MSDVEKPKTYRSYGATTISDNLVVSFNLRFLLNIIIGASVIGWMAFRYETRLRHLELGMEEHSSSITELIEKHILQENEEIQAMEERISFFEKELDINPLSILSKLKKKRK